MLKRTAKSTHTRTGAVSSLLLYIGQQLLCSYDCHIIYSFSSHQGRYNSSSADEKILWRWLESLMNLEKASRKVHELLVHLAR